MTEMVHGTMPAHVGEPVLSRWWRTVDRWTIACVFLLIALGFLMVLAASQPLALDNNVSPFFYFQRHVVFVTLSLGVMLTLSLCEPVTLRRLSVFGLIAGILVLAALPFVGTDFGKGATRWISLGFTSIQPSEFVKPVLIVVAGWLLAAGQDLHAPPGRAMSAGLVILVVSLLVIQPDFGQSALIIAAWGAMYFVSGASMAVILGIAGSVVVSGMIAYESSEHFQRRILGFLTAEVDERSQIGYAMSAIQEGGFFGMGVGEGQVKWQLPDAHTDFVIAVAAEEFGFVMVAAIIALYAVICLRALSRLTRERDPFVRIAGVGLVSLIAMQSMINMGVAVRLFPAKGMTLPFISQGGSSLLATGVLMGMLLALTRSRPQGQIRHLMRSGGV